MSLVIDYTEVRLSEYGRRSVTIIEQHVPTAPLWTAGFCSALSEANDYDARASAAWSFDEWLGEGLSLLKSLRESEARYAAAIAAGTISVDPLVVRKIHAMYEQWYAVALRLVEAIDAFELAGGLPLDNAAEFRDACREGAMPGLGADRLIRAAAQKRGRSLGEAVDAIRRGAVGPRS